MLAETANAFEAVTRKPKGRRRFLFIGGPFGPFFRQLATRLESDGAEVLHAHMHGADFLDWGFRDAVIYRGPYSRWRAWLCALMDQLRPSGAPHSRLITPVTDRPGHDRRYAIDARKISSELGWRPRHSFEQGLEATVRWTLANLDWCERVGQRAASR